MKTKERMMQLIAALGMSKAEFERVCGLSNGYVNSIRNTIGSKGIAQILAQFPQVNKSWLVFGEGEMFVDNKGEMIYAPINQEINGGYNTQVAGNNNQVNSPATLDKAISEISEQRKMLIKSQEQIDRLIAVIEKMADARMST